MWIFNPLTPERFAENAFFGPFGDFQPGYRPHTSSNRMQGAPAYSKRHLKPHSTLLFPLVSRFTTFVVVDAH